MAVWGIIITFADVMGTRDDKERDKTAREATGKYFYDISKLTYVGMVLAGAMIYFQNKDWVAALTCITIGLIMSVAFFVVGKIILNKK